MSEVRFSGIASGIDTEAIIQATLDAKRTANIPTENKKAVAERENEAYEELNSMLLKLRGTLEGFMTIEGSAVTKLASSSKPDAVSVTASQSAQAGSVSVRVDQLASAGTLSFSSRFSSTSEAIAPSLTGTETLSITVGDKVIDVDVDSTTTLGGIVDQINAAGEGAVNAGIINAGSEENPEYLLMVNSLKTGTKEGSINISSSPALDSVLGAPILEQARDAELFVTGVGQITRSSNTITNVVPGVTLELNDVTTASAQITVRNDVSVTASKVEEFVNSFNEMLAFSKDQSNIEIVETERGPRNEFGSLSRTRVDEQAIRAIRSALSGARSSVDGSAVAIFPDLGITTNRDGTLDFDKDKFTEAVNSDPASADSLLRAFADETASTSGVIAEYTRFGGIIEFSRRSNETRIESINDRLQRFEQNLAQQEENLRLLFSRLESNIGRLNSQSASLISILGGL